MQREGHTGSCTGHGQGSRSTNAHAHARHLTAQGLSGPHATRDPRRFQTLHGRMGIRSPLGGPRRPFARVGTRAQNRRLTSASPSPSPRILGTDACATRPSPPPRPRARASDVGFGRHTPSAQSHRLWRGAVSGGGRRPRSTPRIIISTRTGMHAPTARRTPPTAAVARRPSRPTPCLPLALTRAASPHR